MKKLNARNAARRNKKTADRLANKPDSFPSEPVFKGKTVHYEIPSSSLGTCHGGIAAVHALVRQLGLPEIIDEDLELLKQHRPYSESDHVLNLAYNVLCGGSSLEDLEVLRNDSRYMDMLGAVKIPDPTTAGDFLRRFTTEEPIVALIEAFNTIRPTIWEQQDKEFREWAVVDIDGTIVPTSGECKEGIDMSYNGKCSYHPLLISLQNSREPLYIVNRSGNRPSHDDCPRWIDRTLDLLDGSFDRIFLRGDTDFSLTGYFDSWDQRCTFLFGIGTNSKLTDHVERLNEEEWNLLQRPAKYDVKTFPRERPANIKEQVVRRRGYKNIILNYEEIAEFEYQPNKCSKTYRVIALRKNLTIARGENALFDEHRYFYYITNDWELSAEDLVYYSNGRCDHENDIKQLKGQVKSLQAPSNNLCSNWAYMVITSLAWTLKSWLAMLSGTKAEMYRLIGMSFNRFVRDYIRIACEVIHSGRQLKVRLTGTSLALCEFLKLIDRLKYVRC